MEELISMDHITQIQSIQFPSEFTQDNNNQQCSRIFQARESYLAQTHINRVLQKQDENQQIEQLALSKELSQLKSVLEESKDSEKLIFNGLLLKKRANILG